MTRRLAAIALGAALAACGGGNAVPSAAPPEVAPRHPSAGDALLALLPAGADAVAEVDLARLRLNPVVGPVIRALAGRAAAPGVEALGFNPVADADVLVAAVYDLGRDGAATVVVARGAALDATRVAAARDDAWELGPTTVVVAPAGHREAIRAVDPARSLLRDGELIRIRDEAVPAGAPGSAVRVAARLDREARIEVAGRLGLDEAPATISLWLDVADDLALVALLSADDIPGADRLVAAVEEARDRWRPFLRVLDRVSAERRGLRARVIFTLGPRALAGWVDRALRVLEAPEASRTHLGASTWSWPWSWSRAGETKTRTKTKTKTKSEWGNG